MLELLGGTALRVRIEPPRSHGEEFWIERPSVSKEHWQVKRQIAGQNSWTLNALEKQGVLTSFLFWLKMREECVFASITDAPSLRTLAARARKTNDFSEFKSEFISDTTWTKEFKELLGYWNGISEEQAFQFLKLIHVRSGDDLTLETSICQVLHVRFDMAPRVTLGLLRSFYAASVHQTLNADSIYEHLTREGVRTRRIIVDSAVIAQIKATTTSYIEGQRARLVGRKLIPSAAAREVCARILNSTRAGSILVTGTAGAGKSGCLLEIAEQLEEANIPVLAFRLDRLEPVQTATALGKQLELQESPALVLGEAFRGRKVALVVDQLDFVSATSGRHPDFFDTVAALISEVRGLRAIAEIHFVAACRHFDFHHDSRLRSLLEKGESPVALSELSKSEVETVIKDDGGDPRGLSEVQLKLLRLPQNLALFIEAGLKTGSAFVTQTELLGMYWRAKNSALSLANMKCRSWFFVYTSNLRALRFKSKRST